MTGIEKAIAKAGGQEALAQLLGCSQPLISKWKRRGHVPLKRVVEIEAQLGVPRKELVSARVRDLVGVK